MDASDLLLTQWVRQVKQIWSDMHPYRQESFALAILGIVLAGQAVMQRVAEILHERSNLARGYLAAACNIICKKLALSICLSGQEKEFLSQVTVQIHLG